MFRGARRSDLEQILEIYAHARKAMADSGNPTQWGDSYPPQEMLEEDIDSNRLFVYTVNGRLEAVFAFILGPDPTYAKIEDGQWLSRSSPTSATRTPAISTACSTSGTARAPVSTARAARPAPAHRPDL